MIYKSTRERVEFASKFLSRVLNRLMWCHGMVLRFVFSHFYTLDMYLDIIRYLLVWAFFSFLSFFFFFKKELGFDTFVKFALGSHSTATNLCTNIKSDQRSIAAKWTYSPFLLPYKGLFSTFCKGNIYSTM